MRISQTFKIKSNLYLSERENEFNYLPIRFPLNVVYADSENQTKYHYISWLNSVFWDQIYKGYSNILKIFCSFNKTINHFKDHWFTTSPNLGEKGNVYLKNKENTIKDFFALVKSSDALTFPQTARELIRNYKENQTPNAVRIHYAIKQVINYTWSLINSHQNERLESFFFD